MKRARRLRKGPEFDDVFREGTVVHGPLFVVRVRPNGVGHVRWGFAVGKKMAPLASERNRVRRLLREAAELLGDPVSCDVIVVARPGVEAAGMLELSSALAAAMVKASDGLEARR